MIARFFAYYAPYRGLFLLDFGCAVIAGLLELAFPMAVKLFVDELLPTQSWSLIVLAALGLLVLYVANTGLMAIVTYWGHMLGINIETDMRRKAFDHLQKLSFSFYDENKTGHLVGRVTKDLEEIGEVAHHGPEDLFIAVMTFIGAFVLMLTVNVELALLTALIVPAVAWVTTSYGGRMTQNFRGLFERVGDFNVRIEENVGGMRVVQAFANEEHERSLFARDNAKYRSTKLEAYKLMAATSSLSYMSMRLVQLVVMLAGSWLVLQGSLTYGGFVGFLLLVGVFFRPIEKINSVIETYPKGIAGFRRYLELLETEPDVADRPGARPVPPLKGEIRYSGVSFGYGRGRRILESVDLAVSPGQTVAFVGPSGAGKTTICSLLPRFYEIEAGSITIDGIDIRDMTLASLRSQIGIVQQDVFVFGGTIRENIAYGRLGASEADILDAARRAHLEKVLDELPAGLDTIVGERGVKLSGGQKQRLAIARIFLKNPPILILDEATSALDSETEREIQKSLAELAEGRTTLVIAHRLATIRNADRIFVVDRGGIAEEGTHRELIARDSAYRRMLQAQDLEIAPESSIRAGPAVRRAEPAEQPVRA
ncbi:ABC transporter ATP-binding protein [Faunimonas sp. B44]|uniref:ABC transporter ATP-binding protein n=1 Tax=Faunimonas sp. B44 TaxID=3461493 RepID=UPI004044A813